MSPRQAYALFMALAIAVFLVARHFLPRRGDLARMPRRHQIALALAAFVGGAFGAKLPFIAGQPGDWFQSAVWLSDGKTLVTGLAGAYLAVELMKLVLGIRIKTGDTFALPLALAFAVGRWGCFYNGCCFGTPTTVPWAMNFGDGIPRHPTQIYESLFHASMAVILILLMSRGLLVNQRLKFYLIAYCLYRFATEFIRPEPAWCLGLTFYQCAALALAAALALQWLIDARHLRITSEQKSKSLITPGANPFNPEPAATAG